MVKSGSQTFDDNCGVILSPGFPGLVSPGLWTWILRGPDKAFFTVYPYYIKGPGLDRKCLQYFQSEWVTLLLCVLFIRLKFLQCCTPFAKHMYLQYLR